MVPLKPVTSTAIAQIGYDPATRTLAIQRTNSAFVYLYKDVPPEEFRALEEAESIGKFVNQRVQGKYDFDRIDTSAGEDAQAEPRMRAATLS